MTHPFHRPKASLVSFAAASALAFAGLTLCDTAAADAPFAATASCDPTAEPGRVKCSIEARATGGRSISWADIVIVELPDFATALKGRIGPSDVTSRDASSERWAFGLVARKHGDGTLKARVRAVICEPGAPDTVPKRCTPMTVDVRAIVHVG